ncbi:MAG TPA: hypothetical protein PLC15_04965 [Candidatus Obscuribacter sp.]|nr:hypothetical protein [Candidatus Obscuribacter sp.]HMW92518.1 hypothetical protein [Candidatus Obscuribacter sp.]HMY55105.1 hypothetical protein [Candidatus Obscuribacter sp.]HNB14704.1 hypothetical protein [Candidatus Obscuribacter sp.]HND06196.1 hypothetical protein [Candidatus Obscuribacter sp.]
MFLKVLLSALVLLGPANAGVRTTEMLVPLPEQPVRSFSVTESEFVEKLRKPLGRKKILAAPLKSEPGAVVKPESGATVKPEPGAAVKPESSAAVKPVSSAAVKPEPGVAVKAEGGDGKSASVPDAVSKESKSAIEAGEAVASAVDYKIADEKNSREVPILLQLYRTPAGKLTAVRLRVPFDWRKELVAPGKLALSALVPSMNDKERRAATDLIAAAHEENASFGMADYQHKEVLVKYTGWKDKTRDYAILDFCLPPQEDSSSLETGVNESTAQPASKEHTAPPEMKVGAP